MFADQQICLHTSKMYTEGNGVGRIEDGRAQVKPSKDSSSQYPTPRNRSTEICTGVVKAGRAVVNRQIVPDNESGEHTLEHCHIR